jgi:hypothetical protein
MLPVDRERKEFEEMLKRQEEYNSYAAVMEH